MDLSPTTGEEMLDNCPSAKCNHWMKLKRCHIGYVDVIAER